jgi:hypothetical protein
MPLSPFQKKVPVGGLVLLYFAADKCPSFGEEL